MENNVEYQKWLEVVEEDGMELENVPEEFKTLELCLIAVKDQSSTLIYVPEELKTKELYEIVVSGNGYALIYIPEEFKTYEMCELAMQELEVRIPAGFTKNPGMQNFLENYIPEEFQEELAEKYDIDLPEKSKGR